MSIKDGAICIIVCTTYRLFPFVKLYWTEEYQILFCMNRRRRLLNCTVNIIWYFCYIIVTVISLIHQIFCLLKKTCFQKLKKRINEFGRGSRNEQRNICSKFFWGEFWWQHSLTVLRNHIHQSLKPSWWQTPGTVLLWAKAKPTGSLTCAADAASFSSLSSCGPLTWVILISTTVRTNFLLNRQKKKTYLN